MKSVKEATLQSAKWATIERLSLLKVVGIAAVPLSAPAYIKPLADIITQKSGGEGASREFVETILHIADDDIFNVSQQYEQ